MIGPLPHAIARATTALSTTAEDAMAAGESARAVSQLAEQALLLAGTGALLGLGLGITVSGVATYLYKRKQITEKLDA